MCFGDEKSYCNCCGLGSQQLRVKGDASNNGRVPFNSLIVRWQAVDKAELSGALHKSSKEPHGSRSIVHHN